MKPRAPLTLTTLLSLFSLLLLAASPAAALQIFFEVEQEIEEEEPGEPGEAFWIYRYTVVGEPLEAGQGFSILFNPDDIEFVFALPAGDDWDTLALQPDPLLPDYGVFDALALVDDPDLGVVFRASFGWTGVDPPSAQNFVVYDTDFSTLETGTTLPIPEPTTALMVGVGLALAALSRRRDRYRDPA